MSNCSAPHLSSRCSLNVAEFLLHHIYSLARFAGQIPLCVWNVWHYAERGSLGWGGQMGTGRAGTSCCCVVPKCGRSRAAPQGMLLLPPSSPPCAMPLQKKTSFSVHLFNTAMAHSCSLSGSIFLWCQAFSDLGGRWALSFLESFCSRIGSLCC